MENILGLPIEFYNNLLSEDDWSFVIKLSALFEAASAQALAAKLKHSEIEGALSYIEQVHPRYGKITLMLQLNIINKERQLFLTKIAELRNKIVHKKEKGERGGEGVTSCTVNKRLTCILFPHSLYLWAEHGE